MKLKHYTIKLTQNAQQMRGIQLYLPIRIDSDIQIDENTQTKTNQTHSKQQKQRRQKNQ